MNQLKHSNYMPVMQNLGMCVNESQLVLVSLLLQDNTIHQINHYPVGKCWQNKPRYH